MISILIPIYNFDVTQLVKDLITSADLAKIDYQIIVMDDCSSNAFREKNTKLAQMMNVNYIELSENIGRARIRNKLAKLARYEKLIFLDCDSQLIDDKFISKYLDEVSLPLVYGGRRYGDKMPESNYLLHWKYGSLIESQSLDNRQKQPVVAFLSNNFMCDATLLKKYSFNEDVVLYGYEDLAFAHAIASSGYRIVHIDNPIMHLGLDSNQVFLNKQKDAIDTLNFLHINKLIPETKLIKTYNLLQKLSLLGIIELVIDKTENYLTENLNGSNPNLYFLQLLKLNWFIKVKRNKNIQK